MDTKTSILIVDDDPNLREILSGILQARGYAPIGVATGKAALDRVEEEIPAVALIDLKLEDMTGLELMREIKGCCPGTECILLTGYASQESAIEAVNLGAYSYVQKPYDMEQLLVIVRRAVEKREAEEALRKSEQEKSLILSSLSELVIHQDRELRIIWANRAAAESVGSSPEQLVGRHCYEIWQQRGEPCVGCPVVKAIETGQLQEAEITTPDGRMWFIRGYPVRGSNGDIAGAVEVTSEITERKRVEEEIRQRTAQLEALREVGLGLTAQLNLDVLLHSIVSRAVELLGGTSGGLDLYRPERDVLEWTTSIGLDPAPSHIVFHRGEGLSGKVWETGEPLIVDDYHHWEGRAAGFEDCSFTAVVGVPVRWGDEFLGVLEVLADPLRTFSLADADLLSLFATQAAIAIQNARLYEQAQQEIAERKRAEGELQQSLERVRKSFEGTVEVLVSTTGIRDPYTAGHQRRVTQLVCAIANEMGLSEEQIEGLRMAGMVHDIGKISIPAEILSKPGQLSDLEWGMIQAHPQIGYDILKTIEFPWPVAQIVLQHHERLDGSGYPQGLSDDDILLEARILAVADVVVAMASHRPYRSACGLDKALEEISQNKGVLYDAEVVDVCLKLFTEKGFEFD